MDFNPAFDTNVRVHLFKGKIALVPFLIEFFFSFLTVGAGFTLNKVKLFPTEASRGGAQVVLVRGSIMCISCTAKLIFVFHIFIGRTSPCRASSSPISFLRLVHTTSVRWRRWQSLV